MQAPFTGFESVYRRELPFVWAAARRMGVHPAALDDAVQDVFLTAYRRWGDLHYEVSPRAWLYGVTRRVAFRYRRSEARTLRRKAAVGQAAERSIAPHAEHDGARDVDAVLADLEPTRREVFVMAELLDMSGPEIAAELGIPLNTVYSRLRLARRQLERTALRGRLGAWAAAVRREDRPPPGQAQRGWAALLPMLSPGATTVGMGGAVGAASTTGTLLGGLGVMGLVGALVAAVAVGGDRGGEGRSEPVAREVTASLEPRSGSARARPPEEASLPPDAIADAPPSTDVPEAAPALPQAPSRPTDRARSAPPAAAGRELASAPSSEAQGSGPSSTLEAEVAVLDRATAALRSDDAARALQWLAEHEQRFPAGRLADVRKATRVRVLCRLGHDAQARAEAAALRREHPDSAVARRVPDSCAEA